jgi:hypothetical protein
MSCIFLNGPKGFHLNHLRKFTLQRYDYISTNCYILNVKYDIVWQVLTHLQGTKCIYLLYGREV